MKRRQQMKGFTLLEMLAALAVFALIASLTYAAIQPAGEGFLALQEQRDRLEQAGQLERRLRLDVNWLARTADEQVQVLKITHDVRGGDAFDHLWLLVADESGPALTRVHYGLDESRGELVRESRMPWARTGAQPLRWDMGKATSFEVRAMNGQGRWRETWDAKGKAPLPRAIRVRWRAGEQEREIILPVFLDPGR